MVQHALVTCIVAASVSVFSTVADNPAGALTSALLPSTPTYLQADRETAVKAFEAVGEVLSRR